MFNKCDISFLIVRISLLFRFSSVCTTIVLHSLDQIWNVLSVWTDSRCSQIGRNVLGLLNMWCVCLSVCKNITQLKEYHELVSRSLSLSIAQSVIKCYRGFALLSCVISFIYLKANYTACNVICILINMFLFLVLKISICLTLQKCVFAKK